MKEIEAVPRPLSNRKRAYTSSAGKTAHVVSHIGGRVNSLKTFFNLNTLDKTKFKAFHMAGNKFTQNTQQHPPSRNTKAAKTVGAID